MGGLDRWSALQTEGKKKTRGKAGCPIVGREKGRRVVDQKKDENWGPTKKIQGKRT